jgi:[ribosomal protein S18]-alanine N-acetyltransferase
VGSGWSVGAFERELHAGASRLVVLRSPRGATETGGIVAYCAFRVVADEMELLSLAVTPEWRRQGLGGWLARLAFAMGARRGARTVFLEVRSGNEPARHLYDSLDFEVTGRRARYYKDPVEDAVVLARSLAPSPTIRDS